MTIDPPAEERRVLRRGGPRDQLLSFLTVVVLCFVLIFPISTAVTVFYLRHQSCNDVNELRLTVLDLIDDAVAARTEEVRKASNAGTLTPEQIAAARVELDKARKQQLDIHSRFATHNC